MFLEWEEDSRQVPGGGPWTFFGVTLGSWGTTSYGLEGLEEEEELGEASAGLILVLILP